MTVTAQDASSQTVKALLSLRDLILTGALKAGDRISELSVVERLGMSRTPIRMALVRLEEEGLLELIPSGGFSVKDFSERDIYDAIEIRGTLEGLCARLAAERGLAQSALGELRDCVGAIDALLRATRRRKAVLALYRPQRALPRTADRVRQLAGADAPAQARAQSAFRLAQRASCWCRPSCPRRPW